MKRPAWVLPAAVLGAVAALAVLLSPLAGASRIADVILPSILPLGFYAAGLVAAVLVPAQPVGHRVLAVGTLHLGAFALGIIGPMLDAPAPAAWLLGEASLAAFALGFVALFDALARYPDGEYALPGLRSVTSGAAVVAIAAAVIGGLGTSVIPSVVDTTTVVPNPFWVRALEPMVGMSSLLLLLPPLGLVLMLVRYRAAPPDDRAQMRWPIGATVAVVVGVATTGLLEDTLGRAGQTAIFIVAASALPAAFLIGLLRQAREADRVAALEASRRRVADAAVEERRRIERDLHDGAQQHLVALLARIELARHQTEPGSRIEAELGEIAAAIGEVHRELRELARGIYPAILSDRGLGDAVASAVGRLPLRTDLSIAPSVATRRYAPAIEGAAYLFVLEGLTNVMKHSGAERASVSLTASDSRLEVAVTDNGRGFDLATSPGATLQSLRDRVVAVGGELLVESRPGRGTRLRGRFPGAALGPEPAHG